MDISLKSFEYSKGLERIDVLDEQNISVVKSKEDETTKELIKRLKKDQIKFS